MDNGGRVKCTQGKYTQSTHPAVLDAISTCLRSSANTTEPGSTSLYLSSLFPSLAQLFQICQRKLIVRSDIEPENPELKPRGSHQLVALQPLYFVRRDGRYTAPDRFFRVIGRCEDQQQSASGTAFLIVFGRDLSACAPRKSTRPPISSILPILATWGQP